MKKTLYILMAFAAVAMMTNSCYSFLKEDPKTFEQPGTFYQNEDQVRQAANGAYYGTRMLVQGTGLNSGGEIVILTEMMCGYAERTHSNILELTEILTNNITSENAFCYGPWSNQYNNLENVNGLISVLSSDREIEMSQEARNTYLGEMYFLRAYYYSNLVRYYGPVPLKLNITTGLSDSALPLNSEKEVYDQIIKDLETAESLLASSDWNNAEGRVSKGTVKAHLAKMYLTMAGYPIQDASYYDKAYQKALEVVNSGAFSLYKTYNEARNNYNTNGGEYLFSTQCLKDNFENPLHMASVPRNGAETFYPEISKRDATRPGGCWRPVTAMYNSYPAGDLRAADHGYYFTSQTSLDGTTTHTFAPSIYKYWNNDAAVDGKDGDNFPLIRYTDVLLTLAEAACKGGSTTDAAAINAWWQVHSRALPGDTKPNTLTFDQVFKERIWEQAFEGQNWFNMVRTRKAFDFSNGRVVDLIGYKAPAMARAFTEDDLYLPYPIHDVRLNPNLTRN